MGPEEVEAGLPMDHILQDKLVNSHWKTVLVSAVLTKVSRKRESFKLTHKDRDYYQDHWSL